MEEMSRREERRSAHGGFAGEEEGDGGLVLRSRDVCAVAGWEEKRRRSGFGGFA